MFFGRGYKLLRLRRNCPRAQGRPWRACLFEEPGSACSQLWEVWSRCRQAVQGVRTTSMCSSPQHEPQSQKMERVDQQKFSQRILRRKEYVTTWSTHLRSRRISRRGLFTGVCLSLCVCVWTCVVDACVCVFSGGWVCFLPLRKDCDRMERVVCGGRLRTGITL